MNQPAVSSENIIGRRIRQHRLARGWSLAELSDALDNVISRQMLCKYEQGRSQPSRKMLIQLAHVFGVKVIRLVGEPVVTVKFYWHNEKA